MAHMMRGVKSGSLLDQSFRLSITLKGLHAVLETVLGIAILKVNPQAMNRFVLTLLHAELSEDPGDFVATYLLGIWNEDKILLAVRVSMPVTENPVSRDLAVSTPAATESSGPRIQ